MAAVMLLSVAWSAPKSGDGGGVGVGCGGNGNGEPGGQWRRQVLSVLLKPAAATGKASNTGALLEMANCISFGIYFNG